MLIDRQDPVIPVKRQAELVDISRSSVYYQAKDSPQDEALMRLIDRIYLDNPCYGSRKIVRALRLLGQRVNRKRVQRLMRLMGIQAIYPKPNLSRPHSDHPVYPYLLRDLTVDHSDQVWCADITYIPLRRGWARLRVAASAKAGLPGSRHRLAQPVCGLLGTVGQPGLGLLPDSHKAGLGDGHPGNR